MQVRLNKVEKIYRKKIQEILDHEKILTPALMVEIAAGLFQEVKVKNISDNENSDMDMLLYQYGTYNWGNQFGKPFKLDITRQFIKPKKDEPYQLSFTLIYEPEPFNGLNSYDCWSYIFPNLENFISHIKTTDGFMLAGKMVPKTYELYFSQC